MNFTFSSFAGEHAAGVLLPLPRRGSVGFRPARGLAEPRGSGAALLADLAAVLDPGRGRDPGAAHLGGGGITETKGLDPSAMFGAGCGIKGLIPTSVTPSGIFP